jgi:hypothetical protein
MKIDIIASRPVDSIVSIIMSRSGGEVYGIQRKIHLYVCKLDFVMDERG